MRGAGVGLQSSLNSNGGGMMLSSYSWTICLTLLRGVGISRSTIFLVRGAGVGLFFRSSNSMSSDFDNCSR